MDKNPYISFCSPFEKTLDKLTIFGYTVSVRQNNPKKGSKLKFYNLADRASFDELGQLGIVRNLGGLYYKGEKVEVRAVATGKFRTPKKGERYLRGSIVNAWRAPNDLSTKYIIARLVKVRTKTTVQTFEVK